MEFENEKDDFSKVNVKTITVFEFDSEIKKSEILGTEQKSHNAKQGENNI